MKHTKKLKYAKLIMLFAAIYNIGWGLLISLYPEFMLYGYASSTFTLILIKCIGMLVGVYGIAYYFCSLNPVKYWPLIFVGFIGKVLGPIGSIFYIMSGDLDKKFFMINIFNDIIWIIPFSWILLQVYKTTLKSCIQNNP